MLGASIKFSIINDKYQNESEEKRNWIENNEFDIRISKEDFKKIVDMAQHGRTKQNQNMIWTFEDLEDPFEIFDILETHYDFVFSCIDQNGNYREFKIQNAIFNKLSNDSAKITVVGEIKIIE